MLRRGHLCGGVVHVRLLVLVGVENGWHQRVWLKRLVLVQLGHHVSTLHVGGRLGVELGGLVVWIWYGGLQVEGAELVVRDGLLQFGGDRGFREVVVVEVVGAGASVFKHQNFTPATTPVLLCRAMKDGFAAVASPLDFISDLVLAVHGGAHLTILHVCRTRGRLGNV